MCFFPHERAGIMAAKHTVFFDTFWIDTEWMLRVPLRPKQKWSSTEFRRSFCVLLRKPHGVKRDRVVSGDPGSLFTAS